MIKKIAVFIYCVFYLVGCNSFSAKQGPAPVYGKVDSAKRSDSKKNKHAAGKNASSATRVHIIKDPVILKQQELSVNSQTQSSHVVVALLSEADASYQQGNLNESVTTIERALRIEPRNPLLLYKLAKLRLQQGQPDLAENLAKKSELLATGNAQLKKKNWILIAEARDQLGKEEAAKEARQRARQF